MRVGASSASPSVAVDDGSNADDGSDVDDGSNVDDASNVDVARLLAARHGESVRIKGFTDPADPDGAVYERGGLLPGPAATLAGPTYEEWLDGEARK